jgi:hypothetical protein
MEDLMPYQVVKSGDTTFLCLWHWRRLKKNAAPKRRAA